MSVHGDSAPATLHPPRSRTERVVLWLEAVLAIGAYGGAAGLIMGGVDLGGAEARIPFGSMAFGGWALLVINGLVPTIVVIGALRRRAWASAGHVLVGAGLVGWIVVQVGFLGWPPHWLQILYFAWGWVILVLALRLRHTTIE
jgi:hypothetical protein